MQSHGTGFSAEEGLAIKLSLVGARVPCYLESPPVLPAFILRGELASLSRLVPNVRPSPSQGGDPPEIARGVSNPENLMQVLSKMPGT